MTCLLFDAEGMARADAATVAGGMPGLALMEMAGGACARAAWHHFPEALRKHGAVVLGGRGNNGGDGWVLARHLAARGVKVSAWLLGEEGALRGDAAFNWNRLPPSLRQGLTEESHLASFGKACAGAGLLVDAVFGTGLSGQITGLPALALQVLGETRNPILAVDLPSGVDATTGRCCEGVVSATVSVTFAGARWGHFLGEGAWVRGALEVAEIGIDAQAAAQEASGEVLDFRCLERIPYPRCREAHKGDFGHLLVVAGSEGMAGAAVLSAMAALRAGGGRVTLAVPEGLGNRLPSPPPEVMVREISGGEGGFSLRSLPVLTSLLDSVDAFVLGPGLGLREQTMALVRRAVGEWKRPGVVDADALTALAGNPHPLAMAVAPRVLTPHPGEAGRLLGRPTSGITDDRRGAVALLAALGPRVTAVLKGAGTLIATGGERIMLIPLGNPGMATAGSGDVLTGIVGTLLAQGVPPQQAAAVGAFWHGAAGDRARDLHGEEGLLASDLCQQLGPALVAARQGEEEGGWRWR